MSNFNTLVGSPIRNAQNALRNISFAYGEIPPVVPDGIFGEQTGIAVAAFQKRYGLQVSGDIDWETWEKIMAVNDDVLAQKSPPVSLLLIPESGIAILPGEESEYLIPVQAVLLVIAGHFNGLGSLSVTGKNDEACTATVKKLQKIFRMNPDGIIDKAFCNRVAGLYEAHLTRNRFSKG